MYWLQIPWLIKSPYYTFLYIIQFLYIIHILVEHSCANLKGVINDRVMIYPTINISVAKKAIKYFAIDKYSIAKRNFNYIALYGKGNIIIRIDGVKGNLSCAFLQKCRKICLTN